MSPFVMPRAAGRALAVRWQYSVALRTAALALALACLAAFTASTAHAQDFTLDQIDIPGPDGSDDFGAQVFTLPNGNFVVTDPGYRELLTDDVGAVYLFSGRTLALISQLTGSTAGDRVGSGGITVLGNGNFVVSSPDWGGADVGAVTWGSADFGIAGAVSASNSLVGSTANDAIGILGVTALSNGNYVVLSPSWTNGAAGAVGAVTWGNGASGTVGAVSASNSLVGSMNSDAVGNFGVTALTNGNYVVLSPLWDGGAVDLGAVTWGNGAGGTVGAVSASNSLVGSTASDQVGSNGVTALANGNYVVLSRKWDDAAVDVGAVTWGNGAGGTDGAISASNSLVGSTADDLMGIDAVGVGGVTTLSNGNYVVRSPFWDGTAVDVGAVTWGDGTGGTVGALSASNSLVGSTANDQVGNYGATALSNGNYVVLSPDWDGGAVDVGAATWGDGAGGTVGAVSASNSLVGNTAGDKVSLSGVTPLTNGHYVVLSRAWSNGGTAAVGAATWGSGLSGITGTITVSNSLVGSTFEDSVGQFGATALANGNYVVKSPNWDNGAVENAGAVTWGSGDGGTVGAVSASNSLVGSGPQDVVGRVDASDSDGVTALSNGNYVVLSVFWSHGATSAGAVTWGNGVSGITGTVSANNSLVGSTNGDLSFSRVTALSNGNYVVLSRNWDGSAADVGAVTWGNGSGGTVGPISASNSIVGSTASDQVGSGGITVLPDGQYSVASPFSNNGATNAAGAVTLSSRSTGITGTPSIPASVLGTAENFGASLKSAWDQPWRMLVVGRPADNFVTLIIRRWPLTLTRTGNGAGSVTSLPAAIACGVDCTEQVRFGTVVTLTASPAASSTFGGWSGACSGTGSCVVTLDAARAVTATFVLKTFALSVNTEGSGSGVVNGIPANPGALSYGTVVTLTASPAANSTFGGWSGACSGTGPCVLTMDAARAVTATFALQEFAVTISTQIDNGSVSVEEVTATGVAAAGLGATWPVGTLLRFTATPDEGYVFSQWGGDLSGNANPLDVTLTGPINVSALFADANTFLYLPTVRK